MITLAERAIALDEPGTVLRLAAEQADPAAPVTVAWYVEGVGARAVEPVLRVPVHALRELARALSLLAGELGEP